MKRRNINHRGKHITTLYVVAGDVMLCIAFVRDVYAAFASLMRWHPLLHWVYASVCLTDSVPMPRRCNVSSSLFSSYFKISIICNDHSLTYTTYSLTPTLFLHQSVRISPPLSLPLYF